MRHPLCSTAPACITLTVIALSLQGCGQRDGVLAPGVDTGGGGLAAAVDRAATAGSLARPGQYRRIWPHEDGQSWTYREQSRTWDAPPPVYFPTPEEARTHRLTLDDAAALLDNHPIGANPETATGSFGLRFHGLVTTMSGVTRQNLEETLTPDGTASAAVAAGRPGRAFLRLLRRARPDLASRIDALDPETNARTATSLTNPTLLHGYAWEQTDEWVGTYGDLNQRIAWIFLTPDLAPGSEFTLQLVPDLADDVFLHARVLGWKSVSTEAGVFRRAVEVLYLVDFGISAATDMDGNALGYVASYLYGTISYAPGVGPVHGYERYLFAVGDPIGPGNGDLTLGLTATEPGLGRLVAAVAP